MKMDRVPGSGILNHQIQITLWLLWKEIPPFPPPVIMSSFGWNSRGILPTRPSSVQLCWDPHLKVNSPIFFSLNVNSSIGVSKGIGPSTSATYHEWIWRWWSWTVVNRTASPLKTSFNTGLTWRQQRPRVTITTQWTRQFINYLIKISKSWYGCPCNYVRAIRNLKVNRNDTCFVS